MSWLVLLLIVAGIWLFLSYNKLRALAEDVKRRQANIAATVKKRQDIAQRLADIASSYGEHEKLTHLTVVEGDTGMAQAANAAADAARVIGNVQMLANRFPELKANAAYQQLMQQLEGIENSILERREAYNAAAQAYNATRGSLPHLFYAQQMGFAEAPYFEVDEAGMERLMSFSTDDGTLLRETMGRMASRAASGAQQAAERLKAAAQDATGPAADAAKDGPAADAAKEGNAADAAKEIVPADATKEDGTMDAAQVEALADAKPAADGNPAKG